MNKNTQQAKRRVASIIGACVVILLSFVAGYSGDKLAHSENSSSTPASSLTTAKNDGNLVVSQNEKDVIGIVDKVSPAVVSIISAIPSTRPGYAMQGAGTGMIITSDGYVLTNKHVVNGASSATITLSNGKTFKDVKVLGSDPLNDIAFLKIANAKNLPTVELGDSKTVRPGQRVVAIGNALGQFQNTVTDGVISGLGRPVEASADGTSSQAESLADLIQTDAAINSGNSGGPLLNVQGQVIGINTAVAADAQNIGFSIPIGATKGILKHLVATGKVERAVIGVQYVSITPDTREEYGLDVAKGDYVTATSGAAIRPGSPGEKAGFKEKDIIVKVNGQEVGPGKSTSTLVGEFQVSDTITVTVLRAGQEQDLKVTLAAY